MIPDTGDRMKIVIGYALWATVCAAVAGAALSLVHTWFFSYHAGRPGFWSTLLEDFATTLGIAAGQGAVALVGGSIQARPPCHRVARPARRRVRFRDELPADDGPTHRARLGARSGDSRGGGRRDHRAGIARGEPDAPIASAALYHAAPGTFPSCLYS